MSSFYSVVRRQPRTDSRNAWLSPINPPSALIIITLEYRDAEGAPWPGSTWTWGFGTAEEVYRRWCEAHPTLAAIVAETQVVGSGAGNKIIYVGDAPVGPRVQIRDISLEQVAVGL